MTISNPKSNRRSAAGADAAVPRQGYDGGAVETEEGPGAAQAHPAEAPGQEAAQEGSQHGAPRHRGQCTGLFIRSWTGLSWLGVGLWVFHSHTIIPFIYSASLCHRKCYALDQNKQSDWSTFIGWSKEVISLVQFSTHLKRFVKYFHFRVTTVPFLKSPFKLLCYCVGNSQ